MRWVGRHLPVPEVVGSGTVADVDWLLTTRLRGRDATHPGFKADPGRLVEILARGLRRFHQTPVTDCPFDFRLEQALRHVGNRVASGKVDPERDFHQEHRHLPASTAYDLLMRTRPEAEDLVVCHGDFCLPNVLIERNEVVGFVDLGELGVADRWWDLAVATWSTTWNLGPGWEEAFLAEYGGEPDRERIAY